MWTRHCAAQQLCARPVTTTSNLRMCLAGERFPPWNLVLGESTPTSMALMCLLNTYISIYTHTPINAFLHTPAQSSTSMYVHICMRVCLFVYVCVLTLFYHIYHSPGIGVHCHSVTCAQCRTNFCCRLSPTYARFYGCTAHCGWLFSAELKTRYACMCVTAC